MMEEESQKIRVTKRKDWEEDGTEDRRGRKRRMEKGEEREKTEGTEEKEWQEQVEQWLGVLEREVKEGFERIMVELARLEKAWEESVSEGEDGGGEADGEGEEVRDEEMVGAELEVVRGGETENGGDVEMVE